MNGLKRSGYAALGWATWKVARRVVRRKVTGFRRDSGKAKLVVPLIAVAVLGAVIAARNVS